VEGWERGKEDRERGRSVHIGSNVLLRWSPGKLSQIAIDSSVVPSVLLNCTVAVEWHHGRGLWLKRTHAWQFHPRNNHPTGRWKAASYSRVLRRA